MIWTTSNAADYLTDPGLANALGGLLKGLSVVDMGCGSGWMVNQLRNQGIEADGYDGNPNTAEMSGSSCATADLSQEQFLGVWEWVISLEVGEHIETENEKVFLDNLDRACKTGMVLSWAIPGQGGRGHVNERSNLYIIRDMKRRGFVFWAGTTERLRQAASQPWFKHSLMVFYRQ